MLSLGGILGCRSYKAFCLSVPHLLLTENVCFLPRTLRVEDPSGPGNLGTVGHGWTVDASASQDRQVVVDSLAALLIL